MLRTILESTLGPMTNSQFAEVLELATTDIKVNRVDFGKRTSLSVVVDIAISCYNLVQRIKKAAS